MSGKPPTPNRRGKKRQTDEFPVDCNQPVKLQKRCKKCLKLIKGHPLPTGDACQQSSEMSSGEIEDGNKPVKLQKMCKKCLNPIKGHPLPTGDACTQSSDQTLEDREERELESSRTRQRKYRTRQSKAEKEDERCKNKLRMAAARLKLKKKIPAQSYTAWCDPEDDQRPKVDTLIIPKMDEVCLDCGALMFPFETKKK